jgi:two-component system chemotaxis response regulator CheY
MFAAQTTMPARITTPGIPAPKPLRILYADDLRDLREVLRMALTREGHTIECVADGSLALERLAKDCSSFDLLITDHHMPEMNGLELVTRLRALPFRGKVIVFSSELSASVNDAYHALGVDLVLPKPIFPSVLRQVLAELFAPHASAR